MTSSGTVRLILYLILFNKLASSCHQSTTSLSQNQRSIPVLCEYSDKFYLCNACVVFITTHVLILLGPLVTTCTIIRDHSAVVINKFVPSLLV